MANECEPIEIDLGHRLDVDNVEALSSQLAQALDQPTPIKLRCLDLTYIDIAGIQLLLAVRNTLDKDGVDLWWVEPHDTLRESLDLAGLGELIDPKYECADTEADPGVLDTQSNAAGGEDDAAAEEIDEDDLCPVF